MSFRLWETMLAAMKLGVVVIPATTLLTPDELRDRLDRGRAKVVVATQDQVAKFSGLGGDKLIRIVVGASSKQEGWLAYEQAADFPEAFTPDGPTKADDPMLLYFTSGTTAKPKLVRHSQRSYPVGGLSTMYWLGLQPGDIHLNISSPGWAKHAWSCFFAPWNAGATVFVVNQPRFDAKGLLATIGRCGVTTLCAPPTVWRLFIQEKLADFKVSLARGLRRRRAAQSRSDRSGARGLGADHPRRLRPDRNHGTGGQFAGPEGQGRIDGPAAAGLPRRRSPIATGTSTKEGEVTLVLGADRPAGLMQGYQGDDGKLSGADGDLYRSGDVVFADDEGYLTFVGRSDDVFKSSDYRISPFELESILLEHESVAEAAVVPSPDPIRLAIPKAYVLLVSGAERSAKPRCRSSGICTRGWRRSSASGGSNW